MKRVAFLFAIWMHSADMGVSDYCELVPGTVYYTGNVLVGAVCKPVRIFKGGFE